MWLITDNSNIVRDKASNESSLSLGYKLANVAVGDNVALKAAGYKKHKITKQIDVKVGDTYDGKKVTKNEVLRAERELYGIKRGMIEFSVARDKAKALGFTDLENEFKSEYDDLNARKIQLETIISS